MVIATFYKRIPGAVWKPLEACCGEIVHRGSILQIALLGSFAEKRKKWEDVTSRLIVYSFFVK